MLNRVILMGRITQDLDLRTTSSGISVLRFTVAVDRGYARQGEERQTDFISCTAWRQQAEFISRYFAKGRMIAIEGSLRTGSYDDKNGVKHYTTDVQVDSVSFTGEKTNGTDSSYAQNATYKARTPETAGNFNQPANQSISIGGLDDFEEILSDDGVPF